MENKLVIVRGGGDLATGVIQKLHRSGYKVLVLEISQPTFVRRTVALGQAVYDGECKVEDVLAVRLDRLESLEEVWKDNHVPIYIDPKGEAITKLKPDVVVDAILAKRNLGTSRGMAPITIGLGPGFEAGVDVDIVIETKRGHNLARLIFEGRAIENSGVPGIIEGYGKERVLRAPREGRVEAYVDIGDIVNEGDYLASVSGYEVQAEISGLIRGLIYPGTYVEKGTKIGDIDPRTDKANIYTISDKARNIGGAVLEAILILEQRRGKDGC